MSGLLQPLWTRSGFPFAFSVLRSGKICTSLEDGSAVIIDPENGNIIKSLVVDRLINSITSDSNGRIFLAVWPPREGDKPHRYYVFDDVSFEEIADIATPDIESVMVADDTRVYGGMRTDGEIHPVSFGAVNALTGRELWRRTDTGAPLDAKIFSDQVIAVCSTPPGIQVMRAETGALVWSAGEGLFGACLEIDEATGRGYFGFATKRVYSGIASDAPPNSTGRLECRDLATGDLIWGKSTGSSIPNEILVADGMLFMAENRSSSSGENPARVERLDPETGDTLWGVSHGNRGMGRLALSDKLLYVPMVERGQDDLPGGGVLCLNSRDGQEVFRAYFGWMRGIFATSVADGAIVSTYQTIGLFRPRSYWSTNLNASLRGTPVADRGYCILGTGSGDIVCLSDFGSEYWRMRGGSPVLARPAILTQLGVVALDTDIVGLRTRTGNEFWRSEVGSRVIGEISAVRSGSEAFVAAGTETGDVVVLEARTGQIVGTASTESVISTPVHIGEGLTVAGFQDGTLRSLTFSGDPLWAHQFLHIPRAILVYRGNVISADAGGTLRANRLIDGQEQWSIRLDDRITSRQLMIAHGSTFVVDKTGTVWRVSLVDGTIEWRSLVRAPGAMSALILHGLIVVVSDTGTVIQLDPANGREWRKYELNAVPTTDICIDDLVEAAYVADAEGKVHRLII